ncbi:MAG: septum formation initiator family protein, partial [Tissierellia bacterium]|nr:septum formation initiator family protein [Tissierellia bacterium]
IMKGTKRKKGRFRIRNIILLILALHIGRIFISQGILIRDLKHKRQQKEEQISQLEEEIEELEEEIKTKGSLNFVEKVAREDLGMVRPREIIYIDRNRNDNGLFKFRK